MIIELSQPDYKYMRSLVFQQVMNFEDWHSSEHSEAVALFERVFHMTMQEYIENVRDR
mgnify:CR=1 FL=1